MVEVDGSDISKYGVIVPNGSSAGIAGLLKNLDVAAAPSNLASIGRYVLTPDIFQILRPQYGTGGELMVEQPTSKRSRALLKLSV